MRRTLAFGASLLTLCGALVWHSSLAEESGDSRDRALQAFRLNQLEADLRTMPAGAEHEYFAGMAANREGRLKASVRLLTSALLSLRRSSPGRAAGALRTLTDDYGKLFQYDRAAASADELIADFSAEIPRFELQSLKDDAAVYRILSGAVQRALELQIGARTATLNDVTIDTASTGVDNADIYGNPGQDLVSGFDSFTLDFHNMRFTLGDPLALAPHVR